MKQWISMLAYLWVGLAHAAGPQWVVMDARGTRFTPGQALDATTQVQLKAGERLTVIGRDGKTLALRGPLSGTLGAQSGPQSDPQQALAALVATRDARVSAIGVVRAGSEQQPIPSPWLIDASRSGARCVRGGDALVLWRPDATVEKPVSLMPADRSWQIDLNWRVGAPTLLVPKNTQLHRIPLMQIHYDGQEFPIALHSLPATLDTPVMQAAWMLEKGCVQQADALLRDLAPQLRR